jgi:L-lactate dehydrogenase
MKVGIVGAGYVGATAGYALVTGNIASELVFIDKNHARAEGEAMDVAHATPYSNPVAVRAGDYSDLAGASLVIIAAGANQKPGETRLDLAAKNATIFRDIVPRIVENAPNAILLVATNPVDVLTHVTYEASGLEAARVIGSGTTLDTARLRSLVAAKAQVSPKNVHGYVIGEHGDSEIVAWSAVDIAGLPLAKYFAARGMAWDNRAADEVQNDVRRAAYEIINRKGATYYGVASALASVSQAILQNQNTVMTVSMSENGVSYSLPRVVGRGGIVATLELNLSDSEQKDLDGSVSVIRKATESVAQTK